MNHTLRLFFLLSFCAALACCATAGKVESPAEELPENDSALISGVLENRLSYRILQKSGTARS